MPRISIDITEDEHREIKEAAARNGQSIKDFVIARTLNETTKAEAKAAFRELFDQA
ncbi:MAG: DUF1778 domain-containing protein [Rhodobacter sp.]|nr:DUF1778 domain-containing protein [Rhodobacter sp.]